MIVQSMNSIESPGTTLFFISAVFCESTFSSSSTRSVTRSTSPTSCCMSRLPDPAGCQAGRRGGNGGGRTGVLAALHEIEGLACGAHAGVEEHELCVVRDANMGHQLAGGTSSWCPELESRATPAPQCPTGPQPSSRSCRSLHTSGTPSRLQNSTTLSVPAAEFLTDPGSKQRVNVLSRWLDGLQQGCSHGRCRRGLRMS